MRYLIMYVDKNSLNNSVQNTIMLIRIIIFEQVVTLYTCANYTILFLTICDRIKKGTALHKNSLLHNNYVKSFTLPVYNTMLKVHSLRFLLQFVSLNYVATRRKMKITYM